MTFPAEPAWMLVGFFAVLCCLCAAVVVIDLRERIIPNALNLSVAGLGFAFALVTNWEDVRLAALALVQGFMSGAAIWLVRYLYFRFRGVEGIGLGDIKFVGAAGIWVGIEGLPTLVLVASACALAVAGVMRLAGYAVGSKTTLPFGPFLAFGLLVSFALGNRGA